MRTARFHPFGGALVAAIAIPAMMVLPGPATAQPGHAQEKPAASTTPIPGSIRAEHKEIMAALKRATRASGQVGSAARELAKVLQPHFEREEQIALPPLGLLAPLAAGDPIAEDAAAAAESMARSLRAELPRMMDEHRHIRSAVGKLGAAARAAKDAKQEQFAEKLAMHARSEEEVLYPAAILVGDLVRAKRGAAGPERASK